MIYLLRRDLLRLFFFFFNDTATTEIYTLSLHDALPISAAIQRFQAIHDSRQIFDDRQVAPGEFSQHPHRSEEHTSELQSHSDLVCRLLLEKKKKDLRQLAQTSAPLSNLRTQHTQSRSLG